MALALLAFLGGVLTIASPCVLPVLPFVFARTGPLFARGVLPMLLGMVGTFALAATLASVAGGWATQANAVGRGPALAGLALFGVSLVSPWLGERSTAPAAALGARLSDQAGGASDQAGGACIAGGVALGACLGLLWAPCAGPILGLILTTAALKGASLHTPALLFLYALGAAVSLALALFAGAETRSAPGRGAAPRHGRARADLRRRHRFWRQFRPCRASRRLRSRFHRAGPVRPAASLNLPSSSVPKRMP